MSTKQEKEDPLFEMGVDALLTFLEKDDFRSKLVQRLNEHVDLPFINEKTEESVIQALYTVVLESIREIKNK